MINLSLSGLPFAIEQIAEGLYIVDKPVSMPCMRCHLPMTSVEEYLQPHFSHLHFHQRLDTPVSGLMTVTTTKQATKQFISQSHGLLRKFYVGVVHNHNTLSTSGILEDSLIHDKKAKKARCVEENYPRSKRAVLQYKKLKQLEHYDVIKIELETGRFHQIRCQLGARNAPLYGDVKYGAKRAHADKIILLHAYKLQLTWRNNEIDKISLPTPTHNLWKIANKALLLEENINSQ